MLGMKVSELAAACGGTVSIENFDDVRVNEIIIDSRCIKPGDAFAAFRGEKVDGHNYIAKAFESGASCCIGEYCPEGACGPVIIVRNVQDAIERIAAAYRQTLDMPIVGITGSVGKTTAKEMISSVLETHFNVLKTDGNLNNNIGVPITVSRISKNHNAAVIEMGISHFGEMRSMSRVVKPTIAVFTKIGHAHLEFLGDLDGVFKAKTEMLEYMESSAPVIINGDDEKLIKLKNDRQGVISFGIAPHNDVLAENIVTDTENETVTCEISYKDKKLTAVIPSIGMHVVYAALEGAAVGFVLNLSCDEIARGISTFKTVGRRAAIIKTEKLTIIDDCYNANPDSVISSINSMKAFDGRKVCILGDMLELGNNSPELHRQVGEYAGRNGVDLIIASGPLSENICKGAEEKSVYYAEPDSLLEELSKLIMPGDVILVKASRGMHFERITEALKMI